MTVTLRGNRACSAQGALCTGGGDHVTNSPTLTLSAETLTLDSGNLPRVSIENATARENDAWLSFTVKLSRKAVQTVAVDFKTVSGGTATEGADYRAQDYRVLFTPGETSVEAGVALIADNREARAANAGELLDAVIARLPIAPMPVSAGPACDLFGKAVASAPPKRRTDTHAAAPQTSQTQDWGPVAKLAVEIGPVERAATDAVAANNTGPYARWRPGAVRVPGAVDHLRTLAARRLTYRNNTVAPPPAAIHIAGRAAAGTRRTPRRDPMIAQTLPDNLGNFMRTLALPDAVEQWSLTSLREKLIKIGAKIVRHGRYVTFQMAEVVIPRDLFADILRRIDRLRPPPAPA